MGHAGYSPPHACILAGLCQWWLALFVASSFYAARRLSYRARSVLLVLFTSFFPEGKALPARSIVSFDSSSLPPVPLLASNRALEMSRAARRCARKAARGRASGSDSVGEETGSWARVRALVVCWVSATEYVERGAYLTPRDPAYVVLRDEHMSGRICRLPPRYRAAGVTGRGRSGRTPHHGAFARVSYLRLRLHAGECIPGRSPDV
ncbi:hypothetical protein B0H17DRAFT_1216519 [Mycena rosella]|uniref:Uncharacterized protein n=1 Tax=Mycena rosella TaxID=1033263 RepID=A0AAD7C6R6_MYCRO|nr:hypothetical protein B0H17DRAFT_1216519 [Mycena rosella]